MPEEWISQNEYMKRYKVGFNVLKKMIADKELEVIRTSGGHFKIKVNGDTVSRKMYEQEKEKRIAAEQKLEILKRILVEV